MKEYTGKYLYPPRPATKAPSSGLPTYERMGYIAQPKLNGSCGVLFLDGKVAKLMGRHNNQLSREVIDREKLKSLHRGSGWIVLVGEYMNKSQKDRSGKIFAGFVIFDILVYGGKLLRGTTFSERQEILDSLYAPQGDYDEYLSILGPGLFRVKNFTTGFSSRWLQLTKVPMYEGFVLKRPGGILEEGLRENNNTGWQLKIRKATKNYKY